MNVVMPQLGETVLEGVVLNWFKQVGDPVQADERLFEVETDKVVMEIPAPASGVVSEILVAQGVSVKVGTPLAVIQEARDASSTSAVSAPGAAPAAPAASVGQPARASAPGTVLARSSGLGPPLSPAVRKLLGERDIDPALITGTGRNGRITREDVLLYIESAGHAAPPAPPSPAARAAPAAPSPSVQAAPTMAVPTAEARPPAHPGTDDYIVPMNRIRRATAAHMVRSVQVSPHVLQAVEVDFSRVERCRRERGPQWKARHGFSLTFLPFIARAVCEAIAGFPLVNASMGEDQVIVHKRIHLGIAVDVGFEGLVVPVIRDAQYINLPGLATAISDAAARARDGKLKPDELSGGTYTLSNSGPFGTLITAPIISQPQVAILSTDGVRKKPAVVEGPDGDLIAIRPIGVLAQSFDHRAFDGAYSAAFLQRLREILEGRDWLAELP